MPGSLMVETDDAGVRVQGDLQVQDVVDNVLQDFHLAHFLVLRDAGHQLLQLGVAVVHVVQQAHGVVHRGFAAGDAQVVLREAAVFPDGPHRAEGFHVGRRDGEKPGLRGSLRSATLPLSALPDLALKRGEPRRLLL